MYNEHANYYWPISSFSDCIVARFSKSSEGGNRNGSFGFRHCGVTNDKCHPSAKIRYDQNHRHHGRRLC